MNYNEIKVQLGNRESRKVGNNTYLKLRSNGSIAVMLHQTDVVTFHVNGTIELNSNGWQTVTTKARFNAWLPSGLRVYSTKGIWYLMRNGQNLAPYFDKMIINPVSGNVLNARKAA